jgi:hypothetical protein
MADARTHNAPCETHADGAARNALACHFLAEYKDAIASYVSTRLADEKAASTSLIAMPGARNDDRVNPYIGPMVRIFAERVAPYFTLRTHGEADDRNLATTLCHVGAGDGVLATQLSKRLRLPTVEAVDATATPEEATTLVKSFNGKDLPMADQSCDVTLFAYHLHTPTAAHVTTRLLSEARRVTRGYLLLAEDRAGRTVAENERNNFLEPHGTFRSEREWEDLLKAARFDVLASGSMFAVTAPQIFFVARPMEERARR